MLTILLLAAAACAPAQDAEIARSTTLPLDRELGSCLEEYDAALAEGRFDRAAGLLQRLLDADPAALIPGEDPARLLGAAASGRARLAAAPEELLALRRAQFGARAAAELAAALAPPNEHRLVEVARRYEGTEEAQRARRALAEWWADRGQPGLARAWDPRGAEPPAAPPAATAAPARLPAVAGADDPRLPLLDAGALRLAWSQEFRRAQSYGLLVRHRPALGDGLVFVSDGFEVLAIEAGSGALRWRHGGDPTWETIQPADASEMEEAASEHFLSVPVLAEGMLLCVLQEAIELGRTDSYSRIDIRRIMPARRLHAFDAASGRLLWSAAASWDGDGAREPRGIACGAPAVAGGRVYLPVYDAIGTIDFSLQCLELRSGRLLWKRFLASGQLETNLFGNVLRELAVPPPLADLERVQVCSHLGTFHALDAVSGEVQWTRTYPRLPVQPTESGRVARRPQILASNFGVSDGSRVAWTPADSDRAALLDVASGALLAEWPALDAQYNHFAQAVALAPDALWATGTRVFVLPTDPAAAPRVSAPRAAESREYPLGRAAALVRGEILAPDGTRSVERYDATTLEHLGRALDFGSDHYASGALLASSGLLLIARPDGVSAYFSPGSLLAALRDPTLDSGQLEQLLPMAASLDLDTLPAFAADLAEVAEALAARAGDAPRAHPLRLLAAKARIAAREYAAAERILAPLVASGADAHAREACGLLLDEPLLAAASEELHAQAVRRVEAAGWSTLRLRARREEPVPAVLARARAVRAIERGDASAARRALAEVLLLDDPGTLAVRSSSLLDWAAALLRLLLEQPEQRRAFEAEARLALDGAALEEPLLRAYAISTAGQERLRRELQRADLDRAARLQRERWRYEWGDPQAEWPGRDSWLREGSELPALPRALEVIANRAATGGVLAWQAAGPRSLRIFLPVYTRSSVVALILKPSLTLEESEFPLGDLQNRPATLFTGAFATPEGCGVLMEDVLLHFGGEGSFRRSALDRPFVDYDPLLPLGDGYVAGVFAEREGFLRVRVLDGVTGGIYLDVELPGTTTRRVELRRDGRWLFVLEQGAERAYRLDLEFRTAPLAFGLPHAPSSTDLRSAVAMDGGVAYLAQTAGGTAHVVRAVPGREPWVRGFADLELEPVPCARGLAWIAHPLDLAVARGAPRSLSWLGPGAAEPWSREVGGPDARLAENDFPRRFDPRGAEVLVFTREPDGVARVTAHAPGSATPAWSQRLEGVLADALPPRQPQPRPAADGWVISLLQGRTAESRARLHLFLIRAGGGIVAQASLPAEQGAASEFWAEPTAGGVLVRNGNRYLLMGDAP